MAEDFFEIFNTPIGIHLFSKNYFDVGTTAMLKFHKLCRDGDFSETNLVPLATVAAINIAFATELAIKGIYLHCTGKFVDKKIGHQLETIFSLLPKPIQEEIKVKTNASKRKKFISISLSGGNFKHISDYKKDTPDFERNLDIHNNSFLIFRYLFEHRNSSKQIIHFDFDFMNSFTQNVIIKLNKIIQSKTFTSSQSPA